MVVVLSAVRTPFGARGGVLSGWHPADLLARALAAAVDTAGVDPGRVDDVFTGCASQVGSQGFDVARAAVLAAGWPEHVPALTVDRSASSSLTALQLGAAAIRAGDAEVVVVAGVEVMSTTPNGAGVVPGAIPFGPGVGARYRDAGGLVPPGVAAERLAAASGLDRDAVDAWALQSRQRAAAAGAGGDVVGVPARRLDRERGEVVEPGFTVRDDELRGASLTLAELAALPPLHDPDGVISAGNTAPLADGAVAAVLASDTLAEREGWVPRAELVAGATVGGEPVASFDAGVAATARVTKRAGTTVDAFDRIEVHEPFAPVPLAWLAATGVDPARVNAAGGALALGDPTGASGLALVSSLVDRLAPGTTGLAVVAGGGLAGAAVLRRL